MKKDYRDVFILHGEGEMILAILFSVTGFKQKWLIIKKLSRGSTNYTLLKEVSIFITSIVSSSAFLYIFISVLILMCINRDFNIFVE